MSHNYKNMTALHHMILFYPARLSLSHLKLSAWLKSYDFSCCTSLIFNLVRSLFPLAWLHSVYGLNLFQYVKDKFKCRLVKIFLTSSSLKVYNLDLKNRECSCTISLVL